MEQLFGGEQNCINAKFELLLYHPCTAMSESFAMRYFVTLYIKGLQKYDRSKLKLLNSLNKSRTFNFDLSYFWDPFRYRVIQYLIGKLSDMVKMSKEGLVVTALSTSIKMSLKVKLSTLTCHIFDTLLGTGAHSTELKCSLESFFTESGLE